jgi:hypothetical protein
MVSNFGLYWTIGIKYDTPIIFLLTSLMFFGTFNHSFYLKYLFKYVILYVMFELYLVIKYIIIFKFFKIR